MGSVVQEMGGCAEMAINNEEFFVPSVASGSKRKYPLQTVTISDITGACPWPGSREHPSRKVECW